MLSSNWDADGDLGTCSADLCLELVNTPSDAQNGLSIVCETYLWIVETRQHALKIVSSPEDVVIGRGDDFTLSLSSTRDHLNACTCLSGDDIDLGSSQLSAMDKIRDDVVDNILDIPIELLRGADDYLQRLIFDPSSEVGLEDGWWLESTDDNGDRIGVASVETSNSWLILGHIVLLDDTINDG